MSEESIPAGPAPRASDGALATVGPEMAQLLVVALWSSTFIITKAIFAELAPLPYIFGRFAIMLALAAAGLLLRRRGDALRIHRADFGRFLAVGLTGYTLYQLAFVLGLERTSPFSSSLLVALVPLFTVLITSAMGERTPPQGWLGLAVALVGVAIFLWDKRGDEGTLVGDALSLGAAVMFAAYGVLNRPLVRRYPPETYSAYTILFGAVPLFLLALPDTLATDWGALSGAAWVALVYMAILPVYIAYQLWNWAIARRGIAAATAFSLLVPIVSGVVSAIVFGESFGFWKVFGAALVLLGLIVVRWRPTPIGRWGRWREGS
ncbi:MAG: EamA family transporter [Thermomicrobiales bacterium]|nr:EamA family transporter [Thermomicrobiales bacterium]